MAVIEGLKIAAICAYRAGSRFLLYIFARLGPILFVLIRFAGWMTQVVIISLTYWFTLLYWFSKWAAGVLGNALSTSQYQECAVLLETSIFGILSAASVLTAYRIFKDLTSHLAITEDRGADVLDTLADESLRQNGGNSPTPSSTPPPIHSQINIPNELAFAIADIADCTPSRAREVARRVISLRSELLDAPQDELVAAAAAELETVGHNLTLAAAEEKNQDTCVRGCVPFDISYESDEMCFVSLQIICWDRSRTAVFIPW
ncbi:hypothetical protein HDU93_000384 [Gonapodya sp. JEL0774]|nr:hypothetical protein HDU93_000384 [Gonapodya sp. JEL0774]